MAGEHVSESWARFREVTSLDEYHRRWRRLEADGQNVHGEADLIAAYSPTSVLDAGCGMGRVAIDLTRRGFDVVGVDLDADLLDYARRDGPSIVWHHADLAALDLGRTFDVVAMPGNVMLFCDPSVRRLIVTALARHLAQGGLLVAGFGTVTESGGMALTAYDSFCASAGLVLHERFSTWERDEWIGADGYAVSVHRRD